MKKLNTYIDYLKLVMVTILFLLGSITELHLPVLFFLLSAFVLTCGLEGYLLYRRRMCYLRYEQYLVRLEEAVREAVNESEAA